MSSSDCFEDPPSELVPIAGAIVGDQEDHFSEMELRLYARHAGILEDAAAWADIDPRDPSVPQKWLMTMSPEEAERRFRIAQAAWMPNKDAPVGLQLSSKYVASYQKLRASDGEARPLNLIINNSQITIAARAYPTKEIE